MNNNSLVKRYRIQSAPILFVMLFSFLGACTHTEHTASSSEFTQLYEDGHTQLIYLKPDEAAIFGYGSLVSKKSMEKTLGRDYYGLITFVTLEGYERAWNVRMPNAQKNDKKSYFYLEGGERIYPLNIHYLNIYPKKNTKVAGAIFIVKENRFGRI